MTICCLCLHAVHGSCSMSGSFTRNNMLSFQPTNHVYAAKSWNWNYRLSMRQRGRSCMARSFRNGHGGSIV